MKKAQTVISITGIALFFAIVLFCGIMEVSGGGTEVFKGGTAYTDEAVTLKDLALGKLFGVSGNGQVIAGKDGWLFYSETLNDYTGAGRMTEAQLKELAEKIAGLDEYCRGNGADFYLIVAPNKNTVYSEKMPGIYKKGDPGSNLELLLDKLAKKNVNAPDLAGSFRERIENVPEVWKQTNAETYLYYKTDTHWNATGASVVSDYLTGKINGIDGDAYASRQLTCSGNTGGDLYKLLYPSRRITAGGNETDDSYSFAEVPDFEYAEEPVSMMDMDIKTFSEGKQGSVIVYRDSFGSELIPLLSGYFGSVRYLRGNMPYDLTYVAEEKPDAVVLVIAERNLEQLLKAEFKYD
jgi:hypothetical protein